MKKNFVNKTHIEGLIYEHDLEIKQTGPNSKNPGTEYISGTLSIATDNNVTNIVPVHFTYVTAVTAKGTTNSTYTVLKGIYDGVTGTVMKNGKDAAGKVRIDSALALNEFYVDRNGQEELVSAKRNEGGFVHLVDVLNEDEKVRDTFEVDMIITQVIHMDEDPDRKVPERAIVKGAVFDFRKSLLPMEFSAVNPKAIDYFEGLEVTKSQPVCTKVWGHQVSTTIENSIVEESAFGEDSVKIVKNTRKDFVITGASKVPYEWDDESFITATELKEAMAAREIALADIKRRRDEYKASKNNAITNFATSNDSFGF